MDIEFSKKLPKIDIFSTEVSEDTLATEDYEIRIDGVLVPEFLSELINIGIKYKSFEFVQEALKEMGKK